MMEDDDFELVRRCQSRDPDVYEAAFRELYERYQDRVYNTAYRVLGSAGDAADVSQEVFLTIFRKIGEFQFSSRFFTWIYRITVNLSIDRRRRVNSAPHMVGDGATAGRALAVLEDGSENPPDAWADAEFLESRVQLAIMRLSPKLQATVVLRYIEDLPYSEIGDVMNCSIGTVKSRLNRAHRNLEQSLRPVIDEMAAGGEE
ncbi:MAG: sigma-70 family RNA polymerase sigma factor [Planctomycetota bacterium]